MALAAVLWTTVAVIVLAVAIRLDPVRHGLSAAYYGNPTWSGTPLVASPDATPETRDFTQAWNGNPPPAFSATWTGSFLVVRGGRYTFATISDDGSRVYIDGALTVNNGGRHGAQQASASVPLDRGVHSIFIDYYQAGGDLRLDVLWARERGPLRPIPAWALAPHRPGFVPFLFSAAVGRGLVVAEWLWVGALLLVIAIAGWWIGLIGRAWLRREGAWPALGWIVAASTALNVIGVWWGLPGGAWVPDEIMPTSVLGGIAEHFSHGWYNPYPPLHFYLLAASFSPVLLLQWLGRVNVSDPGTYTTLTLVGRLVTVVQGIGVLIAMYAGGARAFGRRAALWAAAVFALLAPFLYYGKTTNFDVPYLFWFAVSFVFYMRILDRPRAADVVGFAIAATFSVCTKDQAYGLFALPPMAIAWRLWQARRDAGDPAPLVHTARVLAMAGMVAAAVFAAIHNLGFNWTGFVLHIHDITGTRSSGYMMFARSVRGSVGLLALSTEQVRLSFGWPSFLVCGAGVILAIAKRGCRRAAWWVAVPAVSYYATFLNVVMYTYDRFLLPICFVLALFGGLALDRFLAPRALLKPVRIAAVAVGFAYTLFYAGTVDALMLRDSRYAVEQWMKTHMAPTAVVGFTFPLQYYPRFEPLTAVEVDSIGDLEVAHPDYFVLDVDYARAEPPTSNVGRMIAAIQSGRAGYHPVFRYRQPPPWPWLPGAHPDLVGPRLESHVYSTLHHINPTIEIFKRDS